MLSTAAAFLRACDEAGLKHRGFRTTDTGKTVVALGVNDSHGNTYTVKYFFYPDEKDVAIRVYGLATGRPNIYPEMLRRCALLNNQYRWIKFVVDEEFDVNMEADCIISPETAGDVCLEMFRIFVFTARSAYPFLVSNADSWD